MTFVIQNILRRKKNGYCFKILENRGFKKVEEAGKHYYNFFFNFGNDCE